MAGRRGGGVTESEVQERLRRIDELFQAAQEIEAQRGMRKIDTIVIHASDTRPAGTGASVARFLR